MYYAAGVFPYNPVEKNDDLRTETRVTVKYFRQVL